MTNDLGLLFLRVSAGLLMAFAHGWGKTLKVISGDFAFADPIGIGAAPSLVLAALAEFVCALLVVLGVKTRYAAAPIAFTMLVAAFVVHAGDPWAKQEFALIYAIPFIALIFTGGGRYTVQRLFKRGR